MVVKTSVSKEAGKGEDAAAGTDLDAIDLEQLKKDLLAACKRMIAASMQDRKER